MISVEEFHGIMEAKGWVIFESAVPTGLLERMRDDIHTAYENCRDIQVKNGIPDNNDFTVHHLIGQADSYLHYLDWSESLDPYLKDYFQGNYILNSFGGAINTKGNHTYAHNIHRDIRSFSGELPLLLNTLVMFDDFTKDNGATFMMSGSHKTHPNTPEEKEFYDVAEQAIAPAGSVLIFNSNVWHAGGPNNTDGQRRSVTPMYCKPYIKPQFDYPRALGYDKGEEFSPFLQQVLGYNARIPANLDEWYQPPEKRMYKPGQG